MGKKRKRKQARGDASGAIPMQEITVTSSLPDFYKQFFEGGSVFPAGKVKKVEPPRVSTLPAAFTDLLKVEQPNQQPFVPMSAGSARWEDVHEFHPRHTKPSRTPFGLQVPDPPLSMRCPECDVRQTPLNETYSILGGRTGGRKCPYCGVNLRVHGSRVLWWR